MADQKINALPVKTAPTTGDKMLMIGAAEEYQIDYDQLATAILNKLTSKTYALDQGTKTLIAALNELNSKSKTQYYDYYYGGVDVDEKMSSIGSAPLTILYFGENLINPPSNPTEWSYFSVIVVHTRAFAFSPSNSIDAFAFRQKVDGVWQNWIYG